MKTSDSYLYHELDHQQKKNIVLSLPHIKEQDYNFAFKVCVTQM